MAAQYPKNPNIEAASVPERVELTSTIHGQKSDMTSFFCPFGTLKRRHVTFLTMVMTMAKIKKNTEKHDVFSDFLET